MRASPNDANPLTTPTWPEALEALTPPPLLLPGEKLENYQILRQAIFAEMAPKSAIEWLLTIDVTELSWEIHRYRVLRHKLLEKSRQRAIACALNQIDLVGIPTDRQENARLQTEFNAFAWRSDAEAAIEIEQRLDSYGFDAFALNSEVHIQARDLYLIFEGLIVSAQHRRTVLLREVRNQRDLIRAQFRQLPYGSETVPTALR